MGRFSATVHIKNNVGRVKFKESFHTAMKDRGFVSCSEDETALSYLFAFSEGDWVTLLNEEYKNDPQKAYDGTRQMDDPGRDHIIIKGNAAMVCRPKIDLTHTPKRENCFIENCFISN